jgi:hypothetical protein
MHRMNPAHLLHALYAEGVKDRPNNNWQIFPYPFTLILSPAVRFAAGERRLYDSYCLADP